MLALQEFETEWMNHHFPTMDLTAEIPFYYGIYQQIVTIVEQKRPLKSNDDWYIIQMLMYVEDAAHLGLCLVYAKKYRMVEDMIGHWAGIMQLSADQIDKIRHITNKAIRKAPESGMVRWIAESVASKDFCRLKDVALFFSIKNHSISLLYPCTNYREDMYQEVFKGCSKEYVDHFLRSDLAFNWVDKERNTVLQRIADLYAEKGDMETANSLLSVKHVPMDCYTVLTLEGNVATLKSKSGWRYENVQITSPCPPNHQHLCFICQMVGWDGAYYLNGAGVWYPMEVHNRWLGFLLWHEVEENEREDRQFSYFTTPSGDKVSCYEDAYGEPEFPSYMENEFGWYVESSQVAKPRRKKVPGRKVPNYKYKPRGKEPFKYFEKKIREVLTWPVRDVVDVNYALRIYEGWTKQAQLYLDAQEYTLANFISSSVFFDASLFSHRHTEYEKQWSRMKKVVKESYQILKATLPHDPANWCEVQLGDFRHLKEKNMKMFQKNGAFDLNKAMVEVESLDSRVSKS